MSAEPLLIQPLHDSRTLCQEGRPVLEFSLCRPHLAGERRSVRRVERYYERLCRAWLERWTGPLYRRACAAETQALSAARPFTPWKAAFTWSVTHSDESALSLCWEAAEETGGARKVCRRSDVWSRKDGRPLLLADLFPRRRDRARARGELARQLEARSARSPEEVLPHWRAGLGRCLRAGQLSLTPEGPALLVPPGLVCPLRTGWQTFPLQGQKGPGL